MQPITYSLILNLVTLALCSFLAVVFSAPWMLVIVVLLQTHALERFKDHKDEEEYEDEQPMGFTANVK